MERMDLLYQKFCREEFDENGVLCGFQPVVPENFNSLEAIYALVQRLADE